MNFFFNPIWDITFNPYVDITSSLCLTQTNKQTPCHGDKKNSTLRLEIEFDAFVMIHSLLYRYCSFRPISPHNFKKVYIVKRCPLYIYSVRNSFNYPMWNVTINPYPMQVWCHHHVPQNCEAKQTISFTRLDGKKFTSRSGIYLISSIITCFLLCGYYLSWAQ